MSKLSAAQPIQTTTCKTKRIPSIFASLAALSGVSAGAATTAIDWGGQYVDQDLQFSGHVPGNTSGSDNYGDPDGVFPFSVSETVAGRALSLDDPFSPPTGYSGTSDTFYGGGSVTRLGAGQPNDGFSEIYLLNQGPNDSIHWRVDTGGDSHTFHLLVYWDKADFLGSMNTLSNLGLSEGAFTISTA